ncbi:MAG: TolC family protein [Desulfurivibrionaceae bacterium]|nr:TolC family protein [Desulfobulbales bacterium]MDT8335072.1 TolC family protein [Desulfurivibrionaceae bacterium]
MKTVKAELSSSPAQTKLMPLRYCLVLTFLLIAGTAGAADLAELQETALANREVIRGYIAELERSRKEVTLARSGLYPSLDVAYTASWLDEATAVEDRENRVASGRISWNIFAGFRDRYRIGSARLRRQAEYHQLQGVKQDIKLAVALRYLAIYQGRANLKVAEDSTSTLAKLHEDAVNRFGVGLIRKSEMLKFKVDLDNAVIAEKKARAELAKSVAFLAREVGAEVDAGRLSFAEFAELPAAGDREVYEEEMLARRSEIAFLEELIGAAAMQVKAERARYYPSVDVAGVYNKYDDPPNSFTTDDDEIRTQLTLSMNLFDGFGKKTRVVAARLEVEGLRHDLAETRQDFLIRLGNLFLDYQVSVDNVVVAESGIAQAEENLRVNRVAYEEGAAAESELLDAIANLSRAKSNYVAALSEGFATHFQIARMVERL